MNQLVLERQTVDKVPHEGVFFREHTLNAS
jgi:hypothetical protein